MKTVKKNLWQKCKEYLHEFFIKHKPASRREWTRLGVLAVSISVFIYCAVQIGYKLFNYVYDDWRNEQIIDLKPTPVYDIFSDFALEPVSEDSGSRPYQVLIGTDTVLNADGRLLEYENLWQRNHDLAGWISMPGFKGKAIYYPVLYSGDNEFYVTRNFDKQDAIDGSIFLDESNSPYQSNPLDLNYNYVIYGHAMKNKSMFGQITDYYKNETSWKNCTKIYIDFMNTRLEYEVFSTFLIDPYYNYRQTHFSSDTEYQAYLNDMTSKSAHDFGIKVGVKDRIVTLSTCYQSTQRTAIVARLVRQIIYVKGSSSSNAKVTPIALPTFEPSPTPRITPSPSASSSSAVSSQSASSSSAASTSTSASDSGLDNSSDSSQE